ncbi:MAG: hypothetical protein ACXAD7_16915, partial [Candidatus Kariarchaeaceae archaeon]
MSKINRVLLLTFLITTLFCGTANGFLDESNPSIDSLNEGSFDQDTMPSSTISGYSGEQVAGATTSSISPNFNNLYLPRDLSNLVVAFDTTHSPIDYESNNPTSNHALAADLESDLTLFGADYHTIEGSFSIPSGTNVLLIPGSNALYTAAELNTISTWFSSSGLRLLWVAGQSDYNGNYSPDACNGILDYLGANLRIAADAVDDTWNNDGMSYRVAAQTPVADGALNTIFTDGVSSAMMHGPTSVLGYTGSVVDLSVSTLPGVEVIMKSSINATSIDQDSSLSEFDYYSKNGIIGNYTMMAIQDMTSEKYVIASGEAIFSDYHEMYNIFTESWLLGRPNPWNNGNQDGKTLVDNVFTWLGSSVATPS